MAGGDVPLVEEFSRVPEVAATLRAFADRPGLILFDSARSSDPLGRYSFLAADPFHVETIAETGEPVSDPLGSLREVHARFPVPTMPGLPPFQGGAAGLLSYDLGRAWEQIPRPRSDDFHLPVLAVGLYDWVIAWDHSAHRAWIISHGFPETEPGRRVDRAARRLRHVQAIINSPPTGPLRAPPKAHRIPAGVPLSAFGVSLTGNFSRDEYLGVVERAIEYIRAGDIFQVNLSQRLLSPVAEHPMTLYLRLRECNPAPFGGYLAWDDWTIASASPERFLRVDGDEVETRPIKGTRRRPSLPEADLYTRDELRQSEKDRAENVMIVDLLRNDLSRVCRPGTIRVPHLCRVESYETVQHLVSEVRGNLRPGQTPWDLLAAAFPGGSITGAPKVRAMEIIAELEPTARGPYCGSLFYVGFDGRTDSNILIRTFTIRDGCVQCPVGGGIVAQSDPAAEYAETWHKAEGMIRALR